MLSTMQNQGLSTYTLLFLGTHTHTHTSEHYAVYNKYNAKCNCTCVVLFFPIFILIQVKVLRQVQVFWFILFVFLSMVRVCPVVIILRLKQNITLWLKQNKHHTPTETKHCTPTETKQTMHSEWNQTNLILWLNQNKHRTETKQPTLTETKHCTLKQNKLLWLTQNIVLWVKQNKHRTLRETYSNRNNSNSPTNHPTKLHDNHPTWDGNKSKEIYSLCSIVLTDKHITSRHFFLPFISQDMCAVQVNSMLQAATQTHPISAITKDLHPLNFSNKQIKSHSTTHEIHLIKSIPLKSMFTEPTLDEFDSGAILLNTKCTSSISLLHNRRSSEIQGTALGKCLTVYTGPCLQVQRTVVTLLLGVQWACGQDDGYP